MKFTVRETIGMPSLGIKKAVVHSVKETTANNERKTPQVAVMFASALDTEHWYITFWFNLRGYKGTAPDYETDANGVCIEDENKTEQCLDILGKAAFRMGLEVAENTDIQDLVGCECSLTIEPHPQKPGKVVVEKILRVEEYDKLSLVE